MVADPRIVENPVAAEQSAQPVDSGDQTGTTTPVGSPAATGPTTQTASLYRMVMTKHVCPFGLKAKDLLERKGYVVDDHWLTTRAQTDSFMAEQSVETTPQIFMGGKRIDGYDALRQHFGKKVKQKGETSYQPIIAIFSMALLIAMASSFFTLGDIFTVRCFELFIAVSMCLLAVQKLQNLESFSTMFLNYDLLAKRWVPYSYLYPFGEGLAGLLMIASAFTWLGGLVALTIGTIGAVSVFKAVYIDKRELKCACVGGGSNVPLGFVSLTENLMMIFMGVWALSRLFV